MAARPWTDGVSRGNSVASCDGAGCVRTPLSLTTRAMATAPTTLAIALNTKTNAMPPNAPAPNAPIAGPISRPPICAAAYRPKASPRRSGGVASVR